LAGIDLLTGKVHALVRDRHCSREFIEFLRLLDAAYPRSTTIKLILDNHSAHISKETRAWLATRPVGRFELENVALESTRAIEIDEFVDRNEIDPRYLIRPYYLRPEGKVGHDAFAVIRGDDPRDG
jgi:hypothetical protein